MAIDWGALNRGWKAFGPGGWMYDTHPSRSCYQHQQKLWWFSPYKDYMTNKSQNEKNTQIRQDFGVDWNDIKYPYLSEVADKGTATTVSGIATSARAIEGLYGQSARAVRNFGSNRDRRKRRRWRR